MCVVKELPIAEYSVVKESDGFAGAESAHESTFESFTHEPPRRQALVNIGGEYRARTGDLLVANQALSQLS